MNKFFDEKRLRRRKNGEKNKTKKTDENIGHYIIASSQLPECRPLERRTLVPISRPDHKIEPVAGTGLWQRKLLIMLFPIRKNEQPRMLQKKHNLLNNMRKKGKKTTTTTRSFLYIEKRKRKPNYSNTSENRVGVPTKGSGSTSTTWQPSARGATC